jgi:hypothetical protein
MNKQKGEETSVTITKEDKLKDRFVDKKIKSINKILFDEKELNEKKVVLVYTGFDCQSCVDKGFQIIKILSAPKVNNKVYIIASNSNIGNDQNRNNYYDFVYNDVNELIRNELKFIYTPVILVLDKDNRIIHINFPETNSNEQKFIEQINRAICND